MANKTTSEKNKPTRKTLRPNEYYNPKQRDMNITTKIASGKQGLLVHIGLK